MVAMSQEASDAINSTAGRSAEVAALVAVLDRLRRTFWWKVSDLDAGGLATKAAASNMTLGGLTKHMALVETDWLAVKLAGQDYGEPWDRVDFEADPEWEWRTGATDRPAELEALWKAAVVRSQDVVRAVVDERGIDGPSSYIRRNGSTPTVRDMLLDMVEEYARHVGHADLLREAVDGRVGENPPPDLPL